MAQLHTPIEYLKGVGPDRAKLLKEELNIFTYEDLLTTYPYRYIDRTKFYKTNELDQTIGDVQLMGQIISIRWVPQKKGKRLSAIFADDYGKIELVWFQGHKWIYDSIKLHTPYVIFGKVNKFNNSFSIPHPELDLVEEYNKKIQFYLQPVYTSTEKLLKRGVSQRKYRKLIEQLIKEIQTYNLKDTLSKDLKEELQMISKKEALLNIHFPKSQELLQKASFYLKFEEFFYIQLSLILKKKIGKEKNKGQVFKIIGNHFNNFYKNNLPFSLTGAQKKVLKEIRKDLKLGTQMNRLLQGDVGSGKTIVSLMSILIAIDNGFQACLMAPTEILAKQHFNSFKQLLEGIDVKIKILVGASKISKRREIYDELEKGELNILIGTHALIEDKVQFKNLGIAIIDEQHRFGVAQRAKLWKKNTIPPHILVMTATPIPRTLAMHLYSDLDISVIDELPPGRQEITTSYYRESKRLAVFQFMKEEIKKGRQIYVVYPLIEESEKMDYSNLMEGYESIKRGFPSKEYQVSILYGKMKPEDKDFEMKRFIDKKTQIMVSTTVIEVGVDVPNASVMIIESAERFGLSQLHQLRGRVGRGESKSYCILMAGNKLTDEAKKRLNVMVETNDGFKIAEEDLKMRGPGDLEGTKQSGILELKIANISEDREILEKASYYAQSVLNEDRYLQKVNNQPIYETYLKLSKSKKSWENIS